MGKMEEAVKDILVEIGEDINRDGLVDTPKRVAKMYLEMTSGIREDPPDMTTFPRGSNDQMIVIKDISMHSLCEHHLIPFFGKVAIGYIPRDNILGLSKFARVVDYFAKRPQIQEQLTSQIADFLYSSLDPVGLMVEIRAEHLCMAFRGVKKPGHKTVTSAIRGYIDKHEFYDLIRDRK